MAGYNPKYIEEFYKKHISGGTVHGEELRAPCPVHTDKDPSFSANLVTGLYHCFNPKCKLHSGGGIVRFLSIIENLPVQEAKDIIETEHNNMFPSSKKKRKEKVKKDFPFTQDDVEEKMNVLHRSPERLEFLKKHCLWTDETIEKYEIGFDGRSYWIPIKENFQLVNIRRYTPDSGTKFMNQSGFGEARIYPFENLQEQEIYIMEGEKDCLLANQLGLNAITVTCGAGTFATEWKEHFFGKDVVICYDCDTAGRSGAQKVFNTIGHGAQSVKIVELPMEEPDNADFTDYILAGNQIQDFHALVSATELALPPSDNPVDIEDEIVDSTLDKVTENFLFYKRARINVRVIGTESSPFVIPRHIQITCNKDNGKNCHVCRVYDKQGKDTMVIDETTPRILDLIECKTNERRSLLRDIFYVPPCKKFIIKEKDHQSINRVSIIPSIDEVSYDDDTQNQTYVERELYFIGERLDANTDYEIETLAVPSPKDQSLVHLGYKVKPADSSIEEFKMSPELKQELGIFTCALEKN